MFDSCLKVFPVSEHPYVTANKFGRTKCGNEISSVFADMKRRNVLRESESNVKGTEFNTC